MGEVSLLTGQERKEATSISGFQTGSSAASSQTGYSGYGTASPFTGYNSGSGGPGYNAAQYSSSAYSGQYNGYSPNNPGNDVYGRQSDLLSRVDISGDETFVVGTSLTMGSGNSASSGNSGSFLSSSESGSSLGYGSSGRLENQMLQQNQGNWIRFLTYILLNSKNIIYTQWTLIWSLMICDAMFTLT